MILGRGCVDPSPLSRTVSLVACAIKWLDTEGTSVIEIFGNYCDSVYKHECYKDSLELLNDE